MAKGRPGALICCATAALVPDSIAAPTPAAAPCAKNARRLSAESFFLPLPVGFFTI